MKDEVALRSKARVLIRSGRLPQRRPDRVWGGAGYGGSSCMLCHSKIGHNEVAMEIEYVSKAGEDAPNACLHTHCFLALEQELLLLEATGQAPSDLPVQQQTEPAATASLPCLRLHDATLAPPDAASH